MENNLTAISLFTGAGGMDVGFEAANVNVVFANELVKEAAETYQANHPGCHMVNDDINQVINTLDQYKGVDLVFGGPPCQGFSVAGKMDPNDERSKLVFTFLDVVEKVRPRIFVMENGQIREHGSHTELLQANGLYAHLWAVQNETESWQMKGGSIHA